MRILAIILLSTLCLPTQAQIKRPDLSPTAIVKQELGLMEITIEYSRPSRKGRKVFSAGDDSLIPNGEYWRVGANSATKFTFSDSVSIAGNKLPAGEYTILCKPEADEWKMSWYRHESTTWTDYVEQTPLFTSLVKVEKTESTVETLEIAIRDIALSNGNLVLEWENTRLSVPIELNDDWKVIRSINQTLNGPRRSDYFQAALYLHESKGDLNTALEYIRKVTDAENARFFQVTREAMILRDLGRREESMKSAKRGLALSKEAENADFVRINNAILKELSN